MCITSATLCVAVLDIRELPLCYKKGKRHDIMLELCIVKELLDFIFFRFLLSKKVAVRSFQGTSLKEVCSIRPVDW